MVVSDKKPQSPKPMKTIVTLAVLNLLLLAARAEIRTLTLNTSVTNSSETITISALQTIELKVEKVAGGTCGGIGGLPAQPFIAWNVNGILFTNTVGFSTPLIVAGPASVRISAPSCLEARAIVTFDIQPSAFPPDKTLTLGAFSGNVKVTMEQSTDLVNWTPAQNEATYTNAPDARFFRIKMERNVPPSQ